MAGDCFLDQAVGRFLKSVAAENAAPGGAAAAVTVALAAGVSAMAGRLSALQLQDSAQVVEQADRLRAALAGATDVPLGSPRLPPTWPNWPAAWQPAGTPTSRATR